MPTLRRQIVRLASQHPELRRHLIPLLRRAGLSWKRETVTIPVSDGEETLNAYVKGNWGVYKDLSGGGWTIAWIPEGLAMKQHVSSKKLAVAIMEAVGERAPAIWRARSKGDVLRHKREIKDVLLNPPYVSKGRTPRRKEPTLDFEGILSSEGLRNLGTRYGKAGEFWGIKGNGRMLSLGRRDVMRNVFFVENRGYQLGSRWTNEEIEYKSKMTENRLRKWARWAKGGYSTRELREIAREKGMASGRI